MGILVIGATFVDIKGFPFDNYLPTGRNAGGQARIFQSPSTFIKEENGEYAIGIFIFK